MYASKTILFSALAALALAGNSTAAGPNRMVKRANNSTKTYTFGEFHLEGQAARDYERVIKEECSYEKNLGFMRCLGEDIFATCDQYSWTSSLKKCSAGTRCAVHSSSVDHIDCIHKN